MSFRYLSWARQRLSGSRPAFAPRNSRHCGAHRPLPNCQWVALAVEELETREVPASVSLGLTGFNGDVIYGSGEASVPAGTTTTMDGGSVLGGAGANLPILGDSGLGPGPLPDANGLPASLTFTSAANPLVSFTLQPYTAANDLQLADPTTYPTAAATATATLTSPTAGIATLHILAASANGPTINTIVLNFSDGSMTTLSNQTVPDWTDNTGEVAITNLARITQSGNASDTLGTLTEIDIPLSAGDQAKTLDSVTFTNDTLGSSTTNIFAISADLAPTVTSPPPGPAPAPAVAAVDVAFTLAGQQVTEIVSANGVLTEYNPSGSFQLATDILSAGVAFGPQGKVLVVVDSTGTLTQYDAGGAHALAGGVRGASVAITPDGAEVLLVTMQTGAFFQYDASGAHELATGVLSTSLTFGPQGEVLAVVDSTGTLTQYDAGGAHVLAGGVSSVGVAFGPQGEVLEVIDVTGQLTQYDPSGTHVLAASVDNVAVAFGPSGESLAVVDSSGTLTLYDAFGAHLIATGVRSANLSFVPKGPVLLVVTQTGSCIQYDDSGTYVLTEGLA
ncbi:cadherin-like domain-containing protein (plasmid) [Frigoriglobus tundricola]|uniref:Cadherin-like domain-containing protein n=1 Tax=Frigoriglobus tundricola TaxID=2774151 RepID=A0A6M5Z6L8_9BACT|nr:cadherin-like domain-containing protein [Frigoriglobus tundricola]